MKQSSRNTKQNIVSFANKDEVFLLDTTLRDEDKERRWYTATDRATFREDIEKTITKLDQKGGSVYALNAEKYCLRGLEGHYHPKFLSCKTTRKQKRRDFVRDLVELQEELSLCFGQVDDQKLREFSLSYSSKNTAHALEMAQQDYDYIQEEIFPTKKRCNGGKFFSSRTISNIVSKTRLSTIRT